MTSVLEVQMEAKARLASLGHRVIKILCVAFKLTLILVADAVLLSTNVDKIVIHVIYYLDG